MKISVVVPIYNEADNINQLLGEIQAVLKDQEYEIITVNDGSRDNTRLILNEAAAQNKNIKVIHFHGNFGQTAAISCGIHYSSGDVIIPIDSDLENDPKDILKLLGKINEGYDVVSGWRKGRWSDQKLRRRFPSMLANKLISRITRVKLNDYGCTLKAYRKSVMNNISLYGEMHRFIPAYASWRGAKISEVEVDFRPRRKGKSNYGMNRIFKVLLDLVVVKFLDKYMTRPMHFFGGVGFLVFFLGVATGLLTIILKILGLRDFVDTPLPILCAFLIMVGVQLVAMGVLAEMLMRIYFESQNKKSYQIAEKINFE